MNQKLARLLLVAPVLIPGYAGAVTQEDFKAKTTRNLLNLRTASANDPQHKEAIHFRHGNLVGAYAYHMAQHAGPGAKLLVCVPDPPPSRSASVTSATHRRDAGRDRVQVPDREVAMQALTRRIGQKEETVKKMKILTALFLTVIVALTGCAGMTDTQQRTVTGGLGGAGGGAIAGNAGMGAAIGAAAAVAGGYLYGKYKEAEQDAYQRGYQQGQQSR